MLATWAVTVCLVCFSLCDSALGPTTQDSCDATGDCPAEPRNLHVPATEDSHQPATDDSHAVTTKEDAAASEGRFSRFWKSATGAVQSTVNVAKNTVYSTLLEPTVDRVKAAVREEVSSVLKWLETQVFSPDQPLGKFVRAVGTTALTMTLALLCILFSYLFLWCFSLLFVLAFNCTMFLLHHFYGPEWIFGQLEWGCEWIYWVLKLMVTHPYVSAFLVVLLFLSSFFVQLYGWEERRSRVRRMDRIDHNVIMVKEAIAAMEEKIDRRLRQIESHLGVRVQEHSDGKSD